MKFIVSSTELLSRLQAVSRVINPKNTLPILDNCLFRLHKNELEITASDLESTMVSKMKLENAAESGVIAIPAKLLTDTLREFSEQPLTFEIDTDSFTVVISSENGKFTIMGQNGADFPKLPAIKEDSKNSVTLSAKALLQGINKTIFATADDELRPVMNGIFVEVGNKDITFVATDSHKLVRYKRKIAKPDKESSFILPKKPASMLKNILAKEHNDVLIEFNDKNASFSLSEYKIVCRLVEGKYPAYAAVIPNDCPNKIQVDRLDLYNSLKRVSVFSNQASNLVKIEIEGNQLTLSAQDIDFSISAYERLKCQYEGDDMMIGFKSLFLIEILSTLTSQDVLVRLADQTKPGVIIPAEKEEEDEDVLMLLMPMTI